MYIGHSLGKFQMQNFQGSVTLSELKCDNTQSIANQSSSPKLWYPKSLLSLHYVDMTD